MWGVHVFAESGEWRVAKWLLHHEIILCSYVMLGVLLDAKWRDKLFSL